ncbi:hypothetical protein EGW08_018230, partial [Elysia chlorotica]
VALGELDDVKALYVNVCQESAAQEAELTDRFRQQLEAETGKIEDRVELEKKEWREFIRGEVRKEEDGAKKAEEKEKMDKLEAELQAKWEKEIELKVAQARLETLQEHRNQTGEERLEWDRKQMDLEEKLRQRMEEILQLSSELEQARAQIDSLKEEVKKLSEAKTDGGSDRLEGLGASTQSGETEKVDTQETEGGGEESLDETIKNCDTSNMCDSTLMSIQITSCDGESSTMVKTVVADSLCQANMGE